MTVRDALSCSMITLSTAKLICFVQVVQRSHGTSRSLFSIGAFTPCQNYRYYEIPTCKKYPHKHLTAATSCGKTQNGSRTLNNSHK